jgi:hypothetical protein
VPADFDHKLTGNGAISNITNIKGSNLSQLGNYPVGFTWVDGTPTTSATNSTTGVYLHGGGEGFRITAPADPTTRTLKLYGGGQQATVKIVAHLSDGSAPDYSDSAADAANNFSRIVTLTYHAATAGQTLTVEWTVGSANGFVHVQSVSLQ